jgi:hypothetical protein
LLCLASPSVPSTSFSSTYNIPFPSPCNIQFPVLFLLARSPTYYHYCISSVLSYYSFYLQNHYNCYIFSQYFNHFYCIFFPLSFIYNVTPHNYCQREERDQFEFTDDKISIYIDYFSLSLSLGRL